MVVESYGGVIKNPKSFTTEEGLMFLSNRKTGGKDTFRVSCGTPTTSSLVLFALSNRELVEHQFAISRRSLLSSEMGTLMSDGRRVKSSLVSST